MARITQTVCQNAEDLIRYKAWMDKALDTGGSRGWKISHCDIDTPSYPSIVTTIINWDSNYKEKICSHSFITRKNLLAVLGLSTTEIKLEFDTPKGFLEQVSEDLEDRQT